MSIHPQSDDAGRFAAPVNKLIETLGQENDTLTGLLACFDEQIEALRRRAHKQLEAATIQVNEQVHQMEQLRQARDRQARLLGRLLRHGDEAPSLENIAATLRAMPLGASLAQRLLDARARVLEAARTTRQRCDEFEFALQYAVRLSREMVQVMQDLDVPPPARVYTAAGSSAHTAQPRSFVNKVG